MKNYFSRNMRALRKSRMLKLEDLASQLGVSRTTLGNWERGVHYPDVGMLLKIREIFDVNLDDLICSELVFKFVYLNQNKE